eukprot:m.943289 g.943289  ORF g.943289 m.943289 type:complete len:104 (-) comp23839_c1_seq13:7-318(-)
MMSRIDIFGSMTMMTCAGVPSTVRALIPPTAVVVQDFIEIGWKQVQAIQMHDMMPDCFVCFQRRLSQQLNDEACIFLLCNFAWHALRESVQQQRELRSSCPHQ